MMCATERTRRNADAYSGLLALGGGSEADALKKLRQSATASGRTPTVRYMWVRTAPGSTMWLRRRAGDSSLQEPLVEKAWVRSAAEDGTLCLKPAMEAEPVEAHYDLESVSRQRLSAKMEWFHNAVANMRVPWEMGHVRIRVRRSCLLEDSLHAVSQLSATDMQRFFRFAFIGAPAMDAGGVAREWFHCVSQHLFSLDTGLWRYSHVDNLTYQINPASGVANSQHLQLFHFAGRFLGKALFDRQVVSAHLTTPLLKHILAAPMFFADLEFLDRDLHRNLMWINDNRCSGQLPRRQRAPHPPHRLAAGWTRSCWTSP